MKRMLVSGPWIGFSICIWALVASCASPLGGQELDITFGPSTEPGLGGTIGLAQKIHTYENVRFDVELDLVHQELEDEGPTDEDDFDQVRFGFKAAFPATSKHQMTTRLGVAWLRTLGDAVYLDGTGDFGGGYLGLGYQVRLSKHLSFNPDIAVLVVDAEGGGDFGQLIEVTWRLIWHL